MSAGHQITNSGSAHSQKLLRSPRKPTRKISKIPFKVLDAPELQDDFYLNLVDWSSLNVLSVGLGTCVYLWSACTSQVGPQHLRTHSCLCAPWGVRRLLPVAEHGRACIKGAAEPGAAPSRLSQHWGLPSVQTRTLHQSAGLSRGPVPLPL